MKKKKFKKSTKQSVLIYQSDSFHSLLDRLIRLNSSFLFVVSSIIISKRMLTKTFVSIIMNKVMLQQIVQNRKSKLFRWTILIQYLTMTSIQCTSLVSQIRIMSVQTSISISNKKINFFCESHDRRKDNNFVQNSHRRFNRCRFRTFLAQALCQARALNLSWSVSFSSISHWYRCLWLCFRSFQSDRPNLWSFESRVDFALETKTITRLWWRYLIYCHARHLFQYSNKKV